MKNITAALIVLIASMGTAMASPITGAFYGAETMSLVPVGPPTLTFTVGPQGIDYTTANFDWQAAYGGYPGQYGLYDDRSPLISFLGDDAPPGHEWDDFGAKVFFFTGTLSLGVGSTITVSHAGGGVILRLGDGDTDLNIGDGLMYVPNEASGSETITLTQADIDAWPYSPLTGDSVPFLLSYSLVLAPIASLSMTVTDPPSPPSDPPAVPEPSPLAVLASGLLVIGLIRRAAARADSTLPQEPRKPSPAS